MGPECYTFHIVTTERLVKALWLLICAAIVYPLLRFSRPFLLITLCAGFLIPRLVKKLGTPSPEPKHLIPCLSGVSFLFLALGYLEWVEGYYFLRSDNKVMFYPVMTFALENFFHGTFPTWNPYQFMGQPLLGSGLYALYYPPLYLAYAIAQFLFHNDRLLFEVFAVLHLVPGYFVFFRLLTHELRVTPWIASFSSLTFVLAGFILIGGRDWYYMLPLALWIPLIITFFLWWEKNPNLRNAALFGLSYGFLVHAGNAQMWVYMALMLAIGVGYGLLTSQLSRRHCISLLLTAACTLLVASPTLAAQLTFGAQANWRSTGDGILHRLNGLLLPSPLVNLPHPNNWGAYSRFPWTAYFFVGYVSLLAAIASLFRYTSALLRGEKQTPDTQFLWMLILAFGFALGPSALFWRGFAFLPIINKFAQPFKFLAFMSFLVPLVGALFLNRIQNARFRAAAVLLGFAGLLAHVPQARAHYDFFQDGDFPALPESLGPLAATPARAMSFSPFQPLSDHYYDTLPHNLPTRFRILHRDGYDGLVENHPETKTDPSPAHWNDYAVRWYLVAPSRLATFEKLAQGLSLTRVHSDDGVTIFESQSSLSMLSLATGQLTALSLKANGFDATVTPQESPQPCVINFVKRHNMIAEVDGKPITLERDALNRMVATLPAHTSHLSLRLHPALPVPGYLVVLALLTLMIELGRYLVRRPITGALVHDQL